MRIVTTILEYQTRGFNDIVDITPDLDQVLRESDIKEGHMLVFVPGATAGITTIEYEPGLLKDVPEFFEKIIPMNIRYYHNDTWHDGNGYAHVRAALLKPDLMIPFKEGKLILGTWQQVVLVDFDNRPRHRRIAVQITGQ